MTRAMAAMTAARAPAFDPRDLKKLELWLDSRAAQGFGVAIPSDGTQLSQWNDLSGNARHPAQAVSTKQPAFRSLDRNLLPDPDFSSTTGSQTLRTNLLTNPQGESASSLLVNRTNLVPNPAFEVDTVSWTGVGVSADGVQGTSAISRDTTDKQSGTASLKVITPGSSIREGTNTSRFATSAARTYTVSLWVKGTAGVVLEVGLTTLTAAGGFLAAAGGSQAVPTMTGSWQKVVATITSPATCALSTVYVRCNPLAATTFWVDEVLVEDTNGALPYFDGATAASGDFTYQWVGTAHNSTSQRKAAAPMLWQGTSTASYWVNTILANTMMGTKSVAALMRGTNGDGLTLFPLPTGVLGKTYTYSMYVKPESFSIVMTASLRFGGHTGDFNSANITCPSGVWTRVSVTAAFPSDGTGDIQPMFRSYTTFTAQVIYFDGGLLEESDVLLPYFDGATTRIPIRRNLNTKSKAYGAVTTGWAARGASCTLTAATDTTLGDVFRISANGQIRPRIEHNEGYTDLQLNDWITIAATFKADTVTRYVRVGAGFNNSQFPAVTQYTVPANTQVRVVQQVQVPAGAIPVTLITAVLEWGLDAGGATPVQSTGYCDVGNITFETGQTTGTFFDGATVASQGLSYGWNGTANASSSDQYCPDYTFAWSGTAHASTAVMNAPNLNYWAAFSTQLITRSRSTERSLNGLYSAKVLWATGGIGGQTFYTTPSIATVIGETYTFSVWVYVPTGSPDVKVGVTSITYGTPTSVKDTWVRITKTFVAISTTSQCVAATNTVSVRGDDVCYFDCAQLEVGSSATVWTPRITLPSGHPVVQFDGLDDVLSYLTTWSITNGSASIYAVYETTTVSDLYATIISLGLGSRQYSVSRSFGALFHALRVDQDTSGPGFNRAIPAKNPSIPGVSILSFTVDTVAQLANGLTNGLFGTNATVLTGTPSNPLSVPETSIGRPVQGSTQWHSGQIMAVLVFNEAHDTTKRQRVERWLGRVFGVTVA